MFRDIRFENEQYGNQYGITAYKDGLSIGILEYAPSDYGQLSLDAIEASPKYPGIGSELLQRFVQIAGPSKIIKGCIIH